MRILVTGACGYVGSALVPKLVAAGHSVWEVDTEWFRPSAMFSKADVRYIDDIGKTDCIIHLAAISNDPSVAYYPRRSWETSVLATQQLAQMAVRTNCRFIYASSVSVYGADRGMVTEDMDLHPISDYNKTKMCAERVLLSYPSLRAQIIRPATICGLSPRMRLDLTVNLFTIQALTKGVITVHGGQQWRPSIHIDDMTDLYVWMVDHPEVHGVFNAGFENHSLMEIADMVRYHTGAVITVTEQRDKRSYQVNSSKLLEAGFKPKTHIHNAIFELKDAYQQGKLEDRPEWYNLGWMQKLGVKDE
jgi:nucleoside-diphosphate-sugar epimerase